MELGEFEPKDWLRCNSCFTSMRNSKVPFCLSICSHIFCSKCAPKVIKKCPRCHTPNIRTMSLVEPLNPEVKHCFESNVKLTEKSKQSTLFQSHQLQINSQLLTEYEKKYSNAKMGYQRKFSDHKTLEKKIRELETKLESSNRQFCQLLNSSTVRTPVSNVILSEKEYSFSSCGNISSDDISLRRSQSGYKTKLTPGKIRQDEDLSSEFRIPSITRVPRSIGSSSRCSNSSKGTSISNFAPFHHRK